MNWILLAIGVIVSSVLLYLFIRKLKDTGMPIDIQNIAMFFIPAILTGIFNIATKTSFKISFVHLLIIAINALLFSWGGNKLSLKAIRVAPNLGYSLVISKSYVLMTSVLSVWLFKSPLTIKSIIAIVLVLLFLVLIVIDKNSKSKDTQKEWIWLALGSFFAWGFQALLLKYLINEGVVTTVILFYLWIIDSIIVGIQLFNAKLKIHFDKKNIFLLLIIGVLVVIFNIFILYGYQYAPNPGYINAANTGSIALLTLFSAWIFKDELNIRKLIGVIGVVGSLILLFI